MPQIHDRGGWSTEGRLDRTEHQLEDWELLTDALFQALGQQGLVTADQLRRGVEGLERLRYEQASYYDRWITSIEKLLVEQGILTGAEIDRKVAELSAAEHTG